MATLLALLVTLAGVSMAQVGYEYPDYEAYEYGAYGAEFGEVGEIEVYDEEAVGFPYGNLVLITEGTQGQAIDVVITGPDGYDRTFESEAGVETEVIELPVGAHSIATTDDDLQMGHALVLVQPGQLQTITFTLPPYEEFVGGVGEGYALEAGYYGAEEEFGEGYEPYGDYGVEGYEAYDDENAGAIVIVVQGYGEEGEVVGLVELGVDVNGHVVGPDDDREEFEAGENTLEDLPSGLYSIAATAEGYQVAQTFVQVQPGQTAVMSVRLTGMGDTLGGAVGAVGPFNTWDADASGDITIEEFETGLFTTLAGEDAELAETEFNEGFANLGFEDEYAFSDFDANQDVVVTEAEFTTTYEPTLFNDWDENDDDLLTQDEYGRGWFDIIDANDDAVVDESEYAGYEGWLGAEYGEFEGAADGIGEDEFLGMF